MASDDIAAEFVRIQARANAIEAFYQLKAEWVATFEKLKENGTAYIEAVIYAHAGTEIFHLDWITDAVDYWAAEVYDRLDDYEAVD